jgi:ribosomal protein S18 acetylase RimI-like enzyme
MSASAMPSAAADIDAARVEEAGLNSLQTQRQLFYDGWLLRLSPGKAKRARSVNAAFGSTLPLAAKIAHCERVYAEHTLPLLFRITPFSRPAGLDDALAARGYVAFDETLVQARHLAASPSVANTAPLPPRGVAVEEVDAATFVDVIGNLRGSTAGERDAQRERLVNSPLGKRFVVLRAGNGVACAGQLALDGDLAGVYDVATAEHLRGKGYATLACATLLAWAGQMGARVAYMQVGADNAPAIAVYRKLGFSTLYTYHYRARPGECR